MIDDTAARKDAALQAARQGNSLMSGGQIFAACQQYARALELDPQNAQIHLSFATGVWQLGDRDTALKSLLEAQRLDPGISAAHKLLGQWYLQEGMTEQASACSARAVELAPDDK